MKTKVKLLLLGLYHGVYKFALITAAGPIYTATQEGVANFGGALKLVGDSTGATGWNKLAGEAVAATGVSPTSTTAICGGVAVEGISEESFEFNKLINKEGLFDFKSGSFVDLALTPDETSAAAEKSATEKTDIASSTDQTSTTTAATVDESGEEVAAEEDVEADVDDLFDDTELIDDEEQQSAKDEFGNVSNPCGLTKYEKKLLDDINESGKHACYKYILDSHIESKYAFNLSDVGKYVITLEQVYIKGETPNDFQIRDYIAKNSLIKFYFIPEVVNDDKTLYQYIDSYLTDNSRNQLEFQLCKFICLDNTIYQGHKLVLPFYLSPIDKNIEIKRISTNLINIMSTRGDRQEAEYNDYIKDLLKEMTCETDESKLNDMFEKFKADNEESYFIKGDDDTLKSQCEHIAKKIVDKVISYDEFDFLEHFKRRIKGHKLVVVVNVYDKNGKVQHIDGDPIKYCTGSKNTIEGYQSPVIKEFVLSKKEKSAEIKVEHNNNYHIKYMEDNLTSNTTGSINTGIIKNNMSIGRILQDEKISNNYIRDIVITDLYRTGDMVAAAVDVLASHGSGSWSSACPDSIKKRLRDNVMKIILDLRRQKYTKDHKKYMEESTDMGGVKEERRRRRGAQPQITPGRGGGKIRTRGVKQKTYNH